MFLRHDFADCHYYEDIFPRLDSTQEPAKVDTMSLQWQTESLFWNESGTNQIDPEIQRLLHLTRIMENLPNAFTDATKVTKSHVLAANTPARIQLTHQLTNYTAPWAKHGRPLGAPNKQPRQRKSTINTFPTNEGHHLRPLDLRIHITKRAMK